MSIQITPITVTPRAIILIGIDGKSITDGIQIVASNDIATIKPIILVDPSGNAI
jgi:hypothetical protein